MYITNDHRKYQPFQFKVHPKFTQIGIFWYENIPSGNPAFDERALSLPRGPVCLYSTQLPRDILGIEMKRFRRRVARWFRFKTKNPNVGIFWRTLERKLLAYFTANWSILWPFGICSGIIHDHLV
jgi:hypothetical protein